MDPDDTLEPTYLEKLLQAIEEEQSDIAICGYRILTYRNDQVISEKIFQDALQGSFDDFAEELCVLHRNTLLFGPCNKLFRFSVVSQNKITFGTTKRYEDSTFVYRYLQHCHRLAFTPVPLYNYSKFLTGRITAVASFGNEYCEGAFKTYEEGQKLLQHLQELKMKQCAIALFEERLKEHLQSCVLGEMIVSLSKSRLNWKARKQYIQRLIEKFHLYLPGFDENAKNKTDNFIRNLANKKNINVIVAMTYLYYINNEVLRA